MFETAGSIPMYAGSSAQLASLLHQSHKMPKCASSTCRNHTTPHVNGCSRLVLNALVHGWKQHECTSGTVTDEADGKTASDDDMERCEGIRPEVAEKGTWEEREMASL